jgi:hypothetical protein
MAALMAKIHFERPSPNRNECMPVIREVLERLWKLNRDSEEEAMDALLGYAEQA